MWIYEKKLQFPINIKRPDPRMAKLIITAYGGADGELGAAVRYLSQRFSMPTDVTKSIANDIGSEELGHLEMVGTICHQLLDGADCQMLIDAGYSSAYVEHGLGVYPQDANGVPFSAAVLQSKGDPIVDLTEDLAAEQKAKKMYENLIDLTDDPDVREPLRFLRAREIVHFQRFGEALETVKGLRNEKKVFY